MFSFMTPTLWLNRRN